MDSTIALLSEAVYNDLSFGTASCSVLSSTWPTQMSAVNKEYRPPLRRRPSLSVSPATTTSGSGCIRGFDERGPDARLAHHRAVLVIELLIVRRRVRSCSTSKACSGDRPHDRDRTRVKSPTPPARRGSSGTSSTPSTTAAATTPAGSSVADHLAGVPDWYLFPVFDDTSGTLETLRQVLHRR